MKRPILRVETYYKSPAAGGERCWKAYVEGGEFDGCGCSGTPDMTKEEVIAEAADAACGSKPSDFEIREW